MISTLLPYGRCALIIFVISINELSADNFCSKRFVGGRWISHGNCVDQPTRQKIIKKLNNGYCQLKRNPCRNGGTCTSNHTHSPYYKCECIDGYYEGYCEATRNPCQNGGTCASSHTVSPYYMCSCVDGYYGSTCQVSNLYTCNELVQLGHVSKSGTYKVGPPGEEFNVYCNLNFGEAVTEITHTSMNEIQATSSCNPPGCYTHRPQYTLPMDQIVKVINNSNRCRQFIKYRCKHSVLLYNLSPAFGHWLSRDQEKMLYWGGASSRRPGYCACGETGTCVNIKYKCNCDSNTFTITSDEGFLTDKSKLPVLEMAFGDMSSSNEIGWHTLGKLECMG